MNRAQTRTTKWNKIIIRPNDFSWEHFNGILSHPLQSWRWVLIMSPQNRNLQSSALIALSVLFNFARVSCTTRGPSTRPMLRIKITAYRQLCLIKHQMTLRSSPLTRWDPLKVLLDPPGPPGCPLNILFWLPQIACTSLKIIKGPIKRPCWPPQPPWSSPWLPGIPLTPPYVPLGTPCRPPWEPTDVPLDP